MVNFRKVHILGIGLLTPALAGQPQAADARLAVATFQAKSDADRIAGTSRKLAVEQFYRTTFALSPAEKLKIAGDCIRLGANWCQHSRTKAPKPPARLKMRATIANCLGGPPGPTSPGVGSPPDHIQQQGTMICGSDIRLKRDIVQVGCLDNGIGLYRYRYKRSDQLFVGVMAQEVANISPDAVLRGPDGYLRVDYGRLGIRLVTWDEWVLVTSPADLAPIVPTAQTTRAAMGAG